MGNATILELAFGLGAAVLGFALFMCMHRARRDAASHPHRAAQPRLTVEQCRWIERFQSHVVPCPVCGHRAMPVPGEPDLYACGGCTHTFADVCHNLPPCPDQSTTMA